MTSIDEYAFSGCTSLESVTLPDGLTSINDNAFSGCSSLTKVNIPDSVTSISPSAFSDCTSLIVKNKGIQYVDNWVINADSTITSAKIKDGTRGIANYAFYNCKSLTSITIPDSVISIGVSAFYGCEALTSIVIPESVTSIGNDAFRNCTALESVYYKGTKDQWNKISLGNSNSKLNSVTRYYYSEGNPFEGENAVEDGNYWHYDTDGKIVVWKKQ